VVCQQNYAETEKEINRNIGCQSASAWGTCGTSALDDGGVLGEHKVGHIDRICTCCGAAYFNEEADSKKRMFLKCCDEGILTNLQRDILFHELLRTVFESDHPNSERFLLNIRKYNNALALASTCFKELEISSS
jgi:hypothetical protein